MSIGSGLGAAAWFPGLCHARVVVDQESGRRVWRVERVEDGQSFSLSCGVEIIVRRHHGYGFGERLGV